MHAHILLVLFLVSHCTADTPANCTYEDIRGTWMVNIDNAGQTNKVNCSGPVQVTTSFNVHLLFPDVAVDEDGNRGFWTLIYNQGFEFVINGRKYFAFSMYRQEGKTVTSLCDKTFNGWVHDEIRDLKFPPQNWGCYYATKIPTELGQVSKPKVYQLRDEQELSLLDLTYKQNPEFIDQINKVQSSWKAALYKEYQGLTIKQMLKRSGWSPKSFPLPKVSPHPPSTEVLEAAAKLPLQFDWRDVNGVNYISPVRNQGNCGSCYAFASMGMLEARFRIKSNNTIKPIFSTQNIVSCSNYSQGCDGGFNYLIAGKYSEDFGNIMEQCYPYEGKNSECRPLLPACQRFSATGYYYIGGFYGACSEPLMKLELIKNGPFAIAFEVYKDFVQYKTGIYHHTGFPYLIAGKYTEDFGDIEEQCYPYTPTSQGCHPLIPHCKRYYATNYKYIGGFYGACSEPEMRLDLVRNGPIAVSMEVYTDLQFYTSGVYRHAGLTDKFNPWEITNHVVVIVGYGQVASSGEKFWIVKNSWGSSWGEKGYFRIIRGVDNCSIESMAVGTIPVIHPRSE